MHYKQDPTQLEVYNEGRKRRVLAGILRFDAHTQCYIFTYEMDYLHLKSAISLGHDLPMIRPEHRSKKNQLFASLQDRIPDKQNAAYPEYCEAFGISPDEKNQILLLTTIGRRGPSTFIFEPIYIQYGDVGTDLKKFRQELNLSRWDFAQAFNIPELSIFRIETGKSHDANITRLIHYFITKPDVARTQLKLTGKRIHTLTLRRLYEYYKS